MPRPTKLNDEVRDRIVQAILAGNYFETACQYAGISISAGYEWLALGEGKERRGRKVADAHEKFAQAVRQAEAQAEVHTVAIIKKSLPENPRLALDFLARRHPDRWGPKERRELSGTLGLEHSGEIGGTSVEDHVRAAAAAVERLGLAHRRGDDPGAAGGGDPPGGGEAAADGRVRLDADAADGEGGP